MGRKGIPISFDEETQVLAQQIMEKESGLLSKICRQAVKDYWEVDSDPEAIKQKILKIELDVNTLVNTKKFLNERLKKLEKDSIDNQQVQMAEQVYEEASPSKFDAWGARKSIVEQFLDINFKITEEQKNTLTEEYLLYWKNTEFILEKPMSLKVYFKDKGLQPREKKEGGDEK